MKDTDVVGIDETYPEGVKNVRLALFSEEIEIDRKYIVVIHVDADGNTVFKKRLLDIVTNGNEEIELISRIVRANIKQWAGLDFDQQPLDVWSATAEATKFYFGKNNELFHRVLVLAITVDLPRAQHLVTFVENIVVEPEDKRPLGELHLQELVYFMVAVDFTAEEIRRSWIVLVKNRLQQNFDFYYQEKAWLGIKIAGDLISESDELASLIAAEMTRVICGVIIDKEIDVYLLDKLAAFLANEDNKIVKWSFVQSSDIRLRTEALVTILAAARWGNVQYLLGNYPAFFSPSGNSENKIIGHSGWEALVKRAMTKSERYWQPKTVNALSKKISQSDDLSNLETEARFFMLQGIEFDMEAHIC